LVENRTKMTQQTLVVEDLVVRYGKVMAVRGASLNLRQGEVIAVIGPNSAGKSSLLEAIAARTPGRTVEGSASFADLPLLHMKTRDRWHRGVRLVPQGRQIYPSLSVVDNLRVIADNLGVSWKEGVERSFSLLPPEFSDRLKIRLRVPAGNLSGGEQQMLALARALIGEVGMVLLDEPGLGLAPRITRDLAAMIETWAKRGIGVLVADQTLRRWIKVVDRIYTIVRGHLAEHTGEKESVDQLNV